MVRVCAGDPGVGLILTLKAKAEAKTTIRPNFPESLELSLSLLHLPVCSPPADVK